MKNISTQMILILFLTISVTLVILLEFIFADAKELFVGGAKLSDLTTNICLAYISGYFFYLVTVVLPKRIEREHIKEHAAHLIDKVLFHILFIMQDATNSKIPQQSLKIDAITLQMFESACSQVFMDNDITPLRVGMYGKTLKVGEAVSKSIQELQSTINEIFKYSLYIEPALIALISSASRNSLNNSWDFVNNMGPIHLGNQILMPKRTNLAGYAKYLLEYHILYREIENILVKKYRGTAAERKHSENIKAIKIS